MGLSTIGTPFSTPEEVAGFSFSHQANHVDIQRVIFNKFNTNIALYALDPFQPIGGLALPKPSPARRHRQGPEFTDRKRHERGLAGRTVCGRWLTFISTCTSRHLQP